MKTKILFTLLLGVIALMSCGGPEEPCEEGKLTQNALELATYLTDNYHVGDSVFFTTEKNEIEGFVVKQSIFEPLNETIEVEVGEEFYTELLGYRLTTYLQSKENTFLVELTLLVEGNKTPVYGSIFITGKFDTPYGYVTLNDAAIIIVNGYKDCILTKNVGITTVSDDTHVWTLVSNK